MRGLLSRCSVEWHGPGGCLMPSCIMSYAVCKAGSCQIGVGFLQHFVFTVCMCVRLCAWQESQTVLRGKFETPYLQQLIVTPWLTFAMSCKFKAIHLTRCNMCSGTQSNERLLLVCICAIHRRTHAGIQVLANRYKLCFMQLSQISLETTCTTSITGVKLQCVACGVWVQVVMVQNTWCIHTNLTGLSAYILLNTHVMLLCAHTDIVTWQQTIRV